jgi:diguanylate cyclase (GGDEF)-like protein/PAS domain S-box-containing protein
MKRPSAPLPVIAGFSVMLILMAAVTAIGVTYVGILSKQLSAIVSERNQKAELATAMRAVHEARYQSLMLASGMADPFLRDEEIMRFSRMAREFIAAREKFQNLPLDEAELDLWTKIRAEVRSVEAGSDQAIDLLRADRLKAAQRLIKGSLLPLQETMMHEWSELVAMQRDKNQAALAEAHQASAKARQLTLALSAGAFVVGLIIAVSVIRLSRRLEGELYAAKEEAEQTLQAIDDAVLRYDTAQRIAYLNAAAERLLGVSAADAAGQGMDTVLHLIDRQGREVLTAAMCKAALQGTATSLPANTGLLSASGRKFEVEGSCVPMRANADEIMGGVLLLRDVTESCAMQRKLAWLADHDALTGAWNRHAFEVALSRTLNGRRTAEFPASLLHIELDAFQAGNDTAGHAAADELLRQAAHLIASRIRDSDLLAHLGGNAFALLLSACPHARAMHLAQVIRDCLGNSAFVWNGQSHHPCASIGVVHLSARCATPEDCLAAAQAACHEARQGERGGVVAHKTEKGMTP